MCLLIFDVDDGQTDRRKRATTFAYSAGHETSKKLKVENRLINLIKFKRKIVSSTLKKFQIAVKATSA